eukprot:4034075-Prymnesium_polylepis.2
MDPARIQLLVTSDGKQLGGIRLESVRPKVHKSEKDGWDGRRCKKKRQGRHAKCDKPECMVDGFSQVDKLERSLALYKRELN